MRVQTITDELEKLRSGLPGVRHLVYADIRSKMVLGSASRVARSQESHDALAGQGAKILEFAENSGALRALETDSRGFEGLMISEGVAIAVVTEPEDGEEALCIEMRRDAVVPDVLAAAHAFLGARGDNP